MSVQVVGTEHCGGGYTLDALSSIEFDYDLYCLEIDLFRLESLRWFKEESHLNCELVYHPENELEWLDLKLDSTNSKRPINFLNRSSSKISEAFLKDCSVPDGDGLTGRDIRFVLDNLEEEDKVALVDSAFVRILKEIDDSGVARSVVERSKVNRLILKTIQILNPHDDFNDCHRLMRSLKPYIQPYGDLLYSYRETEIVSNIDSIADKGDDILLVVGFNHLSGVSEKLRNRGFDVDCIDGVINEKV